MPEFHSPSKIQTSKVTAVADLATLLASPDTEMVFTDLLYDGKPFCLHLQGTLAGDAIQASQFGPHTIGFNFEDPTEEGAFERLTDVFDNFDAVDSNWKINNMLKRDKLYIKLKVKNNKYAVRTNVKLNPKNYANAPLHKYGGIDVYAELKAYFNTEKQETGFYFDISKIDFATS